MELGDHSATFPGMALDVTAIQTELELMRGTEATLSWELIRDYLRGKIAEAAIGGGVVSYTINGRNVTKSLSELREILALAEARTGGGIVCQLGEFGS